MTCGKWKDSTVPKTGWILTFVSDCGGDRSCWDSCKFCGKAIRYVHHIQHETSEDTSAGCVCAELLTHDPRGRELEKNLKMHEKYRAKWHSGFNWVAHKANYRRKLIRRSGIAILSVCSNGSWRWAYTVGLDGVWVSGFARTQEQAALDCFDSLYPSKVK